eukprot:15287161-Alexandrium_andersonii.AAC.1
MSAFGGSSPKPLILKGLGGFLKVFKQVYVRRKPTDASATSRLTVHSGKNFTGCRNVLEQSSAYTRTFGFAMA